MADKPSKSKPVDTAQKTPPATAGEHKQAVVREDVNSFLQQVRSTPLAKLPEQRGLLLFGMDATLSRQPTWDLATSIQSEMFAAGADVGESDLADLQIKLIFFRGLRELKASPWTSHPEELSRYMAAVRCRPGRTQLYRMLKQALKEAQENGLKVFVYVGDCFEEDLGPTLDVAGQLALHGTKCFMFHEGKDPAAADAFRRIAELTGGAYAKFDLNAADTLRYLLRAAAAYARGGFDGLKRLAKLATSDRKQVEQAKLLMGQVKN